jgi:hypothetical protein
VGPLSVIAVEPFWVDIHTNLIDTHVKCG